MERLTGCFLLLVVLNSVSAEDKFFEEGGELLLRPPFSGEITSIVWMNGDNLVEIWIKEDAYLQYYSTFKGRTTLDTTTGSLKITNMSPADSGVYSAMINDNFQTERYNVRLIKAVPKPTVLVKPLTCTTALENCTLTCEGNTEKAEPVTYSWKMGGDWMVGEKDRIIINDETIQSVKMFSCQMKNPISEEESDPKPNPFFREKGSTLIKAVPKPTVLVRPLNCATASEICTLTCDGNTEEAEPVTYSWKMRGEWMDGEKDRSIINDETIQSVKMFSCRMKNPISVEESDPKPNPFFREKGSGSSGVGLPVDLFLLVVGILTVVVGAEF